MAKSINHIVNILKEELSGYSLSDDFRLNDEYLVDKCNEVRQVLLVQEYNKRNSLSSFYSKPICCLEVKCLEGSCFIDGIEYKDEHISHYIDLPELVRQIEGLEIKYLGTSDMMNNIPIMSQTGFMSYKYRTHTGNKPYGFRVGNRIFLNNIGDTKFLCLIGILYDPTQICDKFESDEPYPVPDEYKLIFLVKKDILYSLGGIARDEKQNFRDDTMLGNVNNKQNEEDEE